MLFDSMMAYCVEAMISRMRGMAFSRRPGWVRTHQECSAPATRKREVSDLPERSFSSEIAQEWSAVAQSQVSPWAERTPCRCSVILTAVRGGGGRAAIGPATTLVLPTLRVCPPMTIMDIAGSREPPYLEEDFPQIQPERFVKLLILKYFTNKSLFLKDLAPEGA